MLDDSGDTWHSCGAIDGRARLSFEDLTADLRARAPALRGRLAANAAMADITWFRVGGPAQVLFTPADEADLAYFLASLPVDLPVLAIGLGSNLLVRDGGVPGVVVRLGRGFADVGGGARPSPARRRGGARHEGGARRRRLPASAALPSIAASRARSVAHCA